MKSNSEKRILDILSNVIEKDTPDVWDKIKNEPKSRFSDIQCRIPEGGKRLEQVANKKFLPFVAIFVVIIAIIYVSVLYKAGVENKLNMSAGSRFDVAILNNITYYSDFTDNFKLYSMNFDGSNRNKIGNDPVSDLVTDGENIFYKNLNDGRIYKINIDGTGREQLTSMIGWDIHVFGEDIYFSSQDGIYSMKKDGSNLKSVTSISSPYGICFFGSHIYFYSTADSCIYMMNLDGTNLKKILEDCTNNFKIVKNFMYFTRYNTEHFSYLYQANIDDTGDIQGIKKVTEYALSTGIFDIKEQYICFVSESVKNTPALYMIREDESNPIELAEIEATDLHICEEWVYAYHPSHNGKLYKVGINDKTVELLLSYKK